MKGLFYLLLFCITAARSVAQSDGSVRGSLRDTVAHSMVADATVTVLDMRDSSLAGFSRSAATGAFQVGRLGKGSYRLLISHVNYRPFSRNFVITEHEKSVDLGELTLADKASVLDSVTVQQEAPPVIVRNDTIEYNAGSFHTRPNAVVEDLLKKLPGVQVDKDGKIKANGQEVKKVLVDGKEFFGKDPKIATKNLPADVVDKVQVFDKKSDQSQFTGFDDGNSERTVNLTVKKEKKYGVFGRATAGGGDGRYESQFSANQFKGEQQLSALGMWNNTNKQGFSFQDAMGFNGGGMGGGGGRLSIDASGAVPIQGMGQGSQAITATRGGGLNFNDSWKSRVDAGGNYFYNHADDMVRQKSARQYLSPVQSYDQAHTESTDRHNENQRINFFTDTKLDSLNSIKVTGGMTWQRSSSRSSTIDSSRSRDNGALLNTGASQTTANGDGYSWNSTALFRHRFLKKGRTFSANLSWGLDHNSRDGRLYSINQFLKGAADTLNQVYDQQGHSNNYGASLNYTEPLSKRSLLEANYQFYRNYSFTGKETFNADASGKYTKPNLQQTNDIRNTYTYHREGVFFRHQQPKFNFMFGSVVQQAAYTNVFGYQGKDSSLHQTFQSLLPHGQMQYDVNKYRHIQLEYQTSTNPPSLSQLQAVPDNSDPLNIKVGNPGLRQEYNHILRMSYMSFDPFRRTSLLGMLNYSATQHRIVNDDRIDSAGVRTTRPVNLEGLYRGSGFLSWDFPLRAIKAMVNLKSDVQYDHNASLVNGARNNGNTWTVGQEAGIQYAYKDVLDISGSANVTYNDARYSLQPGQNMHYWTSTYSVDGNWWITKILTLSSDLNYIHRDGLPAGYNSNPLVWNAGIGVRTFKSQRGMFQLHVSDILRQNTGFTRNTSQNYIEDVSYKTLSRYWLLSFTYSFSRFAGKAVKGAEGGRVVPDIKIIR